MANKNGKVDGVELIRAYVDSKGITIETGRGMVYNVPKPLASQHVGDSVLDRYLNNHRFEHRISTYDYIQLLTVSQGKDKRSGTHTKVHSHFNKILNGIIKGGGDND